MDRFLPKKCPKCGKNMIRHFCFQPLPCDVKYKCLKHEGGCGYEIKKRNRIRRMNWNPYSQEADNKKNP